MKKTISIVIALLLISNLYAKEEVVYSDVSVAKVNGEDITRADVERAIDVLAPRTYFHANITIEKREKLVDEALDNVIERKLLSQHATKLGIKASDAEIKEYVANVANKLGDKKNFIEALKKANMDYDTFENEIKIDIQMKKLYEKEIKKTYTEAEIKEYYEKNKFKFQEPEKVKVRVIYARNDPTNPDGKNRALKKIKEAQLKIKEGAKFADIASKYSDAMSRVKGGEVGYTHKGMLDPAIDKVAFTLKPGEISEIIEDAKGFYIVNVEEKIIPKPITYEETKGKLKKRMISKIEKQRKKELLEKLLKDAKIEK